MVKHFPWNSLALVMAGSLGIGGLLNSAHAQETLPWQSGTQSERQSTEQYSGEYQRRSGNEQRDQYRNSQRQSSDGEYRRGRQSQTYDQAQAGQTLDPYNPNNQGRTGQSTNRYDYGQQRENYAPPAQTRQAPEYPQSGRAPSYAKPAPRYVKPYRSRQQRTNPRRYGSNQHYRQDRGYERRRYHGPDSRRERSPRIPDPNYTSYSENEVVDAGHRFFGSMSNGLAKAIQWAFKKSGRPNGYILGEDAGGAFIAGLRYGEGKLYTKHHGMRRVFWQGPSIGYDFGGDGNRTMTLVYNLRSPTDVYRRFGGVQGSAYLVGGASVQLLTAADITLAPIRTGVGLRLGANIGYLKYTRRPTWNPF